MKAKDSTIHEPMDGRGPRLVFLNGQEIQKCFYADTKKGVAKVYRTPFQLDKHKKRLLSDTLHGDVRLEIKNEG